MKTKPEWPQTALGELLRERQEKPTIDDLASGQVRIIDKIAFNTGLIHLRAGGETRTGMILSYPGDLVLSGINAAKGAVAINDYDNGPLAATIHYSSYIPNKDRVDIGFLWRMLRSKFFQDLLLKYIPGGIKTELKAKRFLPIPIPLPPLPEQRRILARIKELAGEIERVRKVRLDAENAVQSLIGSFVANYFFDNNPIVTFGNYLIEAKNGIYKPTIFWGAGLPCIRMYNIDGPGLNQDNLKLLEVTSDELKAYGCYPGDLIFNRVNSAELVGKTGIITRGYPLCTFESKNIRLRVDNLKVLPEFAAIVLNSSLVRDYYKKVLKQQCGMATLNQGHVRNIPFPDVSLKRQKAILAKWQSLKIEIDKLRLLQAESSAELDALMPSILDKAFRGEL